MAVCRRNGRCIAHLAGMISDKEYYANVPTPRPADLTGNGRMLMADELRKRFLENSTNTNRIEIELTGEVFETSSGLWVYPGRITLLPFKEMDTDVFSKLIREKGCIEGELCQAVELFMSAHQTVGRSVGLVFKSKVRPQKVSISIGGT